VIYADPPWHWKAYSDKGTGRGAISHYDVMSLPEICTYMRRAVKAHASDHCVMLLWCPDNMLTHGFEVIDYCGFTFKTIGFVWVKTTVNGKWAFGPGFWTRANPEICLLATRGHPKRISAAVRKLVISQVRQHSEKPDEMYEHIERLLAGPYLELFSRQTKKSWDCWGTEAGLFDAGAVPTRRQPSHVVDVPPISTPSLVV